MTTHEIQTTLCNACGQFYEPQQADTEGHHKPVACDAFELESIFIEGRLWVDKVYGNTYFSNRVWINGKVAFEMPVKYGYGLQYVYSALREMHALDYFAGDEVPSPATVRDEMGVHFYHSATYVKKSELFKGAK